jgi:uncharacterized protein (TIGR03435 family)
MHTRILPGAVLATISLAMALSVSVPLRAQAPERLPRFEVASVKPSTNPTRAQTPPGGGFIATQPLKLFIADAYLGAQPVAVTRVLGGPEWIESARYEINAQSNTQWQFSPDGPDRNLLLMLRSLLEERFKLKAHIETREMPVYELVIARADRTLGPELRPSPNDCDAIIAAVRAGARQPARQPNEPPPCSGMRGPARVLAGGLPMAQFARMLTMVLADANGPTGRDFGRLVVDKTGLSGRFAFTLVWTPERIPTEAPPPGIPPIDPNGPTFFTALQEQLGLELQASKAAVEVVVIDSVEPPTAD